MFEGRFGRNKINGGEYYGEPRYGEPPRQYQPEPPPVPRRTVPAGGFFPKSQYGGDLSNVIIYSPSTYDDVRALIDFLKRREQVIVDFTGLDQAIVCRVMDFMSGAIYALNGGIERITKNIFLFAPEGVTITVPPQLRRG